MAKKKISVITNRTDFKFTERRSMNPSNALCRSFNNVIGKIIDTTRASTIKIDESERVITGSRRIKNWKIEPAKMDRAEMIQKDGFPPLKKFDLPSPDNLARYIPIDATMPINI